MRDHRTCPLTATIRAKIVVRREDGRSSGALLSRDVGHLSLHVNDVGVLAGICTDRWWLVRAEQLAGRGEVVHVSHDGMHVISLGDIESVDRARTGSTFMNLGTWSDAPRLLGLSPA